MCMYNARYTHVHTNIHMPIHTCLCTHTHKSLISPLNSMYRAPANCQALLCALRNLTTDKVASFFYAAPPRKGGRRSIAMMT